VHCGLRALSPMPQAQLARDRQWDDDPKTL
jgi:hypothetical protein